MDEEFLNTNPTHQSSQPMVAPTADLSVLLINLLKSVLYRDADERQWAALLNLQARVRDYVAVLNLDLVLDEAEGYAFLKSRTEATDDDAAPRLPRLVARRPLSFAVSLLLALLRKKLAEFDAGGGQAQRVVAARGGHLRLFPRSGGPARDGRARRGHGRSHGPRRLVRAERFQGEFASGVPSVRACAGRVVPPVARRRDDADGIRGDARGPHEQGIQGQRRDRAGDEPREEEPER